jgi:hypothetical protein
MNDGELMALCIYSEAAGETYEGKVAVGRVIRNRMARHYQSDGTVSGTVLHPMAFSGFWCVYVNGKYMRICETVADSEAHGEIMLKRAMDDKIWPECVRAVADSEGGFVGDSSYQALTPDTVLYTNLAISHPVWASADKMVTSIGHHTFYRS